MSKQVAEDDGNNDVDTKKQKVIEDDQTAKRES